MLGDVHIGDNVQADRGANVATRGGAAGDKVQAEHGSNVATGGGTATRHGNGGAETGSIFRPVVAIAGVALIAVAIVLWAMGVIQWTAAGAAIVVLGVVIALLTFARR